MRRLAITALMLLSLNAVFAGIAYAQKTTIDPNALPKAATADTDKHDPRLSQKITYDARHKAVKTILADLSIMTGVTFKAGYNEKDWQVRDRKMNIFAKDIPVAHLMDSIARVMKFKWEVNRDAVPCTYRLYMDRKTLLAANAELRRTEEIYNKEVTRRRDGFADMIENWDDDISPSDLEQLRHDSPYLYMMHVRGGGAAIQGLFKDVPGLKDTFINRQRNRVSIPVSSLSQETQQLVLDAARKRWQLLRIYPTEWSERPFPADADSTVGAGRILFNVVPYSYSLYPEQHRLFGGVRLEFNNHNFSIARLLEPSDPITKIGMDEELRADEMGTTMESVLQQDSISGVRDQPEAEEDKIETSLFPMPPAIEHPDEPALHNKIRVRLDKTKYNELADIQLAVAKASGFAVVSDSYRLLDGDANISDTETQLKDVLNTISDCYRYNWQKHGDTIELWSMDWYKKRLSQIPDEWVEKWRARFSKLGYMCIEDYADILSLSMDQIAENVLAYNEFYCLDLAEGRTLMKLYTSLSDAQRKMMFSDMGLSMKSLGPEQWEVLSMLFIDPAVESGEIAALLKCSVITDKKTPPKYIFRMVSDEDDRGLGQWTVDLPKYEEPPKPAPESDTKSKEADVKSTGSSSQLAPNPTPAAH